jgi:hypothetical protein
MKNACSLSTSMRSDTMRDKSPRIFGDPNGNRYAGFFSD